MGLPREFALIARHFRPLAGDGALDLSDDAALLTPPDRISAEAAARLGPILERARG